MARSHPVRRDNFGFLLAKAMQRWNELMSEAFAQAGYGHVRPSYGSLLVPLFEEDGLRLSDLAKRARLAKQTMTTMVALLERGKLVRRAPDPEDARATRVYLTEAAKRFRPVAGRVIWAIEEKIRRDSGPADIDTARAWLRRFAGV